MKIISHKFLVWLSCFLFGIFLLYSWFYNVLFRSVVDKFDKEIFFFLNGLLKDNSVQQFLWAIANHRAFDFLSACFMIIFFMNFIYQKKIHPSLFLTIATSCITSMVCAHYILDIKRQSPSLILQPVYLLSELTNIHVKDHSSISFPGDHSVVLFTFSLFMFYFGGKKYGIYSLCSLIFILPRLVSGAHWISDVIIGGVSISLIAGSLIIGSKLYRLTNFLFKKIIDKIIPFFKEYNDAP